MWFHLVFLGTHNQHPQSTQCRAVKPPPFLVEGMLTVWTCKYVEHISSSSYLQII